MGSIDSYSTCLSVLGVQGSYRHGVVSILCAATHIIVLRVHLCKLQIPSWFYTMFVLCMQGWCSVLVCAATVSPVSILK